MVQHNRDWIGILEVFSTSSTIGRLRKWADCLFGSVASGRARLEGGRSVKNRPAVFRGRHFQDELIVLCVRWYLRYSLSYHDVEEMMAERSLKVDHSTIARWVLRYVPILNERMGRHLRRPNRSWRVDETYVRVAGKWT